MNKIEINLIIVTYADRYNYVKQVTDWAEKQTHIQRIYISDNSSIENSSRKLKQLEKETDKINLTIYNDNLGPGRAIKESLMKIMNNNKNSFCLILDDDNLPDKNALSELIQFWNENIDEMKSGNTILVCFRVQRKNYLRAVTENRPDLLIGINNMFRTFHIKNIFNKFFKKSTDNIFNNNLPVAPYGGMFFHMNLIEQIGYPDEDFCLYFDDHEFSRRLVEKGGNIFLVQKSIINELEDSWYHDKGFGFMKIVKSNNRKVMYYSIRNRIIFEKKYMVTNYFIYLFNALIYCGILILIMLITLNLKNIYTFINAVLDGFLNKKYIKYSLN
ncbi:MAG TPA: glycosyltransferase [Spirochaetota bacterium]|nr:glycosyltransferase [Spirochaetota bacterium]